jgi:hypothetical protein
MAKKEESQQSSERSPEPKMVRVFSQRAGEIGLQDGKKLKFGEVLLVTEEIAKWLEKTFAGLVKIIE